MWNRLSSGSYFPQPVKAVANPKKIGGTRLLGIPTFEDRIAQVVVKLYFEPKVEPMFYEDSYGYRPNKSAIQALEVTRTRCWRKDWVLEFDIKGLLMCRFIFVTHNKQRSAEIIPMHKKSLQSKNLELKGIGVMNRRQNLVFLFGGVYDACLWAIYSNRTANE